MDTVVQSPSRTVAIGPEQPFCVIGERINPTGRKAFQAQLQAGDLSQLETDVAQQVAGGADMLDVHFELRQVSGLQLRLKRLAPGRVDPLADHAERLLRPDDDRPRRRLDDCVHSSPFPLVGVCRAARRPGRCLPRGGS